MVEYERLFWYYRKSGEIITAKTREAIAQKFIYDYNKQNYMRELIFETGGGGPDNKRWWEEIEKIEGEALWKLLFIIGVATKTPTPEE